jgi:hypothetical protein
VDSGGYSAESAEWTPQNQSIPPVSLPLLLTPRLTVSEGDRRDIAEGERSQNRPSALSPQQGEGRGQEREEGSSEPPTAPIALERVERGASSQDAAVSAVHPVRTPLSQSVVEPVPSVAQVRTIFYFSSTYPWSSSEETGMRSRIK